MHGIGVRERGSRRRTQLCPLGSPRVAVLVLCKLMFVRETFPVRIEFLVGRQKNLVFVGGLFVHGGSIAQLGRLAKFGMRLEVRVGRVTHSQLCVPERGTTEESGIERRQGQVGPCSFRIKGGHDIDVRQ
jgi:hypothetical protein